MEGFSAILIMNVATGRNFEVMSVECSEILEILPI